MFIFAVGKLTDSFFQLKIIMNISIKKHIFWMMLLLIQFSCGTKPTDTVSVDCEPILWPDYNGVTIPKNIAPLNFSTARYASLRPSPHHFCGVAWALGSGHGFRRRDVVATPYLSRRIKC